MDNHEMLSEKVSLIEHLKKIWIVRNDDLEDGFVSVKTADLLKVLCFLFPV